MREQNKPAAGSKGKAARKEQLKENNLQTGEGCDKVKPVRVQSLPAEEILAKNGRAGMATRKNRCGCALCGPLCVLSRQRGERLPAQDEDHKSGQLAVSHVKPPAANRTVPRHRQAIADTKDW